MFIQQLDNFQLDIKWKLQINKKLKSTGSLVESAGSRLSFEGICNEWYASFFSFTTFYDHET